MSSNGQCKRCGCQSVETTRLGTLYCNRCRCGVDKSEVLTTKPNKSK